MQIKVEVPDELASEIEDWQNGADYTLNVTQTAPMQFKLNDAEAAEAEPEDGEAESGPPMPMKEKYGKGGHMPPAIAIIVGGKGQK